MKKTRTPRFLTPTALTLALLTMALAGGPLAAAPGVASDGSETPPNIEGTWGWSFSGFLAKYPFSQVGYVTFQPGGTCQIALRENSGANGGYTHNSSACTYTVADDSTGRIDYSLDGEEGEVEMVVSQATGTIRLVSPTQGTVGGGELRRAAIPTKPSLAGTWTLSMEGAIANTAAAYGAGSITFDGAGKCTGSLTYNYGTGVQDVTTRTCTYTIDKASGIGLADITYSNDTGGDFFFAVMDDGHFRCGDAPAHDEGRQMALLATARLEILGGTAVKEVPPQDEGCA